MRLTSEVSGAGNHLWQNQPRLFHVRRGLFGGAFFSVFSCAAHMTLAKQLDCYLTS
jgi:hypothetical protein